VTGGSDHKVCIWNLLPAISLKYEKPVSATVAEEASGAKNGDHLEVIEEKKHEDEDHKMVSESDR
jgi:hypothetical protein